MKKVIGALFGLAILCVIGVVAVFMLPAGIGGPAGELAGNAKAAVTNAALDVVDVKGKVKSAIDQNKDSIASATGMTAEEVDDALDKLDIDSWQATPLPAEARETGTFSGSYAAPSPRTRIRATSRWRPTGRPSPSRYPQARRNTWHACRAASPHAPPSGDAGRRARSATA